LMAGDGFLLGLRKTASPEATHGPKR
jgi:hypothetical protein